MWYLKYAGKNAWYRPSLAGCNQLLRAYGCFTNSEKSGYSLNCCMSAFEPSATVAAEQSTNCLDPLQNTTSQSHNISQRIVVFRRWNLLTRHYFLLLPSHYFLLFPDLVILNLDGPILSKSVIARCYMAKNKKNHPMKSIKSNLYFFKVSLLEVEPKSLHISRQSFDF